ncbi:MAG: restriction endonuclease subunit S [Chloroflexi bacterium]|nr:restriction endonuclease subunit S [Chloroflexota bacterium]
MELKKGYKLTATGIIPDEWESTTVRLIASPIRNAIVGGPFGSDLVFDDYVNDGVPVIRGQNMGDQWVKGPFVFVTKEKASALAANWARPDDLVFTQRGTMGQVCIVPKDPYEYYLISQSQMKVTLNLTIAHSAFFHYLFNSNEMQRYIQQSTIQTSLPHINLSILRDIPIPRPPIHEQHAIALALSNVDALLAGLDALIAKKHLIKQGAMQELLTGKRRLPGFGGKWKVCPLGEKIEIKKGQLITENNAIKGSIPVIAGGKHPAYYHNQSNRTGKTITISASGANAGFVAFFDIPIFASDCSTIGESTEYSIEFVYQQLLLDQQKIYKLQTGGAQPHIHSSDLSPIEFCFPLYDEQKTIAEILNDMDAEINALEQRREKTHLLKQGLMQELLTGRIRLV